MNLRLSKLPSAKVLLKLEFDTEDQVLFYFIFNLLVFLQIILSTKIQSLVVLYFYSCHPTDYKDRTANL